MNLCNTLFNYTNKITHTSSWGRILRSPIMSLPLYNNEKKTSNLKQGYLKYRNEELNEFFEEYNSIALDFELSITWRDINNRLIL